MKNHSETKILFHLLFWGIYLLGFYLAIRFYGNVTPQPYPLIILVGTQIALVYLITYPLFDHYYKKTGEIQFFFLSASLILYFLTTTRILGLLASKTEVTISSLFTRELLLGSIVSFILVFGFVYIRLLRLKDEEKRERLEMERQSREMELFALRNQIDSHFLFNTLNNIYGLALMKSDLAPRGILLLSEILSFVLYETKKDFYLLEHEIHLIHNYLELEKMRWGDEIRIDFQIEDDIKDQFVTPLILFTFIENSFKHGISKSVDNPWIKIKLSTRINEIVFHVSNSLPDSSDDVILPEGKGIGLENIRRRLNLLYPQRYFLKTSKDDNSFNIELILANN